MAEIVGQQDPTITRHSEFEHIVADLMLVVDEHRLEGAAVKRSGLQDMTLRTRHADVTRITNTHLDAMLTLDDSLPGGPLIPRMTLEEIGLPQVVAEVPKPKVPIYY